MTSSAILQESTFLDAMLSWVGIFFNNLAIFLLIYLFSISIDRQIYFPNPQTIILSRKVLDWIFLRFLPFLIQLLCLFQKSCTLHSSENSRFQYQSLRTSLHSFFLIFVKDCHERFIENGVGNFTRNAGANFSKNRK